MVPAAGLLLLELLLPWPWLYSTPQNCQERVGKQQMQLPATLVLKFWEVLLCDSCRA